MPATPTRDRTLSIGDSMVPALQLWLPVLLSAVGVFVVSSIIHMLLPYHRVDHDDLPDEDAVRDALRDVELPPGDYVIPRAHSMKEMSTPEFTARMEEGPVAFLSVKPSGPPKMGKQLARWFVFSLVVGFCAAYVAGRALAPGAHYLEVFRMVGTAAFLGYAVALWQMPIFYGRKWAWAMTFTFDGFVYACITAGFFGWLWPS